MRLILASSSKNRQELFNRVGWKYEIVKSQDEEQSNETDPSKYVIDLSKNKANSVAKQIEEKAIIVAADTVMYIGSRIFEKPRDKAEAFENLKIMSGKVVYVVTGTTIKDLYQNKDISFADIAEVHLKELSDADISWYIENEKNILKCCGFTIEGKAGAFIDKVVGDYNTIRGISVSKLYSQFKELGYAPSDFELVD